MFSEVPIKITVRLRNMTERRYLTLPGGLKRGKNVISTEEGMSVDCSYENYNGRVTHTQSTHLGYLQM